ncbi:MAG: N4-gp56 family major capsid protein [Clostridia bacterium]|nr:N4-gp56 family major capsid protein [Clostridia bacterium]
MSLTKITNLINPEVMADMISAKIEKKIVVSPFAKIDATLQGAPGDTITIPKYAYIGDAGEVAEGEAVTPDQLTATTTIAKVKKAMKAVSLTDEAVLSGYGNPVGETNNQLALAIASKVDEDAMTALQGATLSYTGSDIISYDGIVDAIDVFEEEINTSKVIFIHPKQVSQLRHDVNFISADKYSGNVIMSGEIGMIANCRVVASKRVPVKSSKYVCPIIKLNQDGETEDESPALTIYLKRDTNVETERNTLSRSTDISADKIYTVALSNASKVVLAKFNQTASNPT